jgi:hypothetical protein
MGGQAGAKINDCVEEDRASNFPAGKPGRVRVEGESPMGRSSREERQSTRPTREMLGAWVHARSSVCGSWGGTNLEIGVDFAVTVSAEAASALEGELRQILQELGLGESVRVG